MKLEPFGALRSAIDPFLPRFVANPESIVFSGALKFDPAGGWTFPIPAGTAVILPMSGGDELVAWDDQEEWRVIGLLPRTYYEQDFAADGSEPAENIVGNVYLPLIVGGVIWERQLPDVEVGGGNAGNLPVDLKAALVEQGFILIPQRSDL
jgi:hypothetical protein